MPEALFKTSGKGGTHAKVCVLFLENTKPEDGEDWEIFMAEAKWCGHDSRGNPTIRANKEGKEVLLDDVPLIAVRYKELAEGKKSNGDLLGFKTRISALKKDNFIAKYYDPKLQADLKALGKTHELVSLERLVAQKILSWSTGIEVGKMAYGTGTISFVRTSDISNWELKGDPKQGVSEAIYEDNKQDVQADDIFIVRDGTYLVGTSCHPHGTRHQNPLLRRNV